MNSLHPVDMFKKFIAQAAVGRNALTVAVGDRFEQKASHLSIWVVERISDVRMSSSPLVRLSREGHPEITKTVSLSAFELGGEYRISH